MYKSKNFLSNDKGDLVSRDLRENSHTNYILKFFSEALSYQKNLDFFSKILPHRHCYFLL